MDDYLKSALEIVKAQASTRQMTSEEITAMTQSLLHAIRAAAGEDVQETATESSVSLDDAKKSIKEKSVVCLECGKAFKVLTKKHLAVHGLTPETYREKYGFKKGAALAAKELVRTRRNKMKDMKLWERRKKAAE